MEFECTEDALRLETLRGIRVIVRGRDPLGHQADRPTRRELPSSTPQEPA
jgi:hypothetical protein